MRGSGLPEEDVITDGGEHIQRALGMDDPEAVYVRADGYIGLRTHDVSATSLAQYLRGIYADSLVSQLAAPPPPRAAPPGAPARELA